MTDKEQLDRLQQQMDGIMQQQTSLNREVMRLQAEISRLRQEAVQEAPTVEPAPAPVQAPVATAEVTEPLTETQPPIPPKAPVPTVDWEQYIGGNLINKIGIAVLLLGLGLFVKYAIDRGLFPPVVRVISGYVAGLALVGTAYYLRKKYEAYSAVLFSGGMATLYFTSYIGCTFFNPPIIGLYFAFWVMGFLTACTIIVASKYEYQIIGLLGLVGAYAVPFLVNTGSHNFYLFFSYITIINIGVLVLAARRDWRAMTYTACLLTWLIMVASLFSEYNNVVHSAAGWGFSIVTILLFYAAILAWHWRWETPLKFGAYAVLIIQALVFYGVIMTLADGKYAGLATLLCATPHFLAAYAVQQRFGERQPFTGFAAIGAFFVTISIPIEFENKNILLLWMLELLVLLFVARKLRSKLFEVMTYILLFCVVIVLLNYWEDAYYSNRTVAFNPIFNLAFLTDMLLMVGMLGLYWLHRKYPLQNELPTLNILFKALPAVLLYLSFFHEIHHAFALEAQAPSGILGQAGSVYIFRDICLFVYSFIALSLVAEINARRWKSGNLDAFVAWTGLACILLFLAAKLPEMNELRCIFITDKTNSTELFILIRYLSYGALGYLFFHVYCRLKAMKSLEAYQPQLPLLFHLLLLVVLSSELVTVMLLMLGKPESQLPYREGFSILWGLYSFLLIGLGFKQKTQTLRVAGMVLFAVTLVKIFFFDLVNLPILSRTGLFLALGVLLLGASYLYQRFRERIEG